MKNVFIAAIIATFAVGCVAQAKPSGPTYAQLADENARLRAEYAKRMRQDGQQGSQDGDQTKVTPGANVARAAMWARPKHGPYMGTVGEQPRQMTQGRKIKVTNVICDDGARSIGKCNDVDGNGAEDWNTWLSFVTVDGEPLICDSGIVHPILGITMLKPQQSCFVETGAVKKVKIMVLEFRNNGDPWINYDFDQKPFASFYVTTRGQNGVETIRIDETMD